MYILSRRRYANRLVEYFTGKIIEIIHNYHKKFYL